MSMPFQACFSTSNNADLFIGAVPVSVWFPIRLTYPHIAHTFRKRSNQAKHDTSETAPTYIDAKTIRSNVCRLKTRSKRSKRASALFHGDNLRISLALGQNPPALATAYKTFIFVCGRPTTSQWSSRHGQSRSRGGRAEAKRGHKR